MSAGTLRFQLKKRNLSVLRNISSKMTLKEIKARIRGLRGFKVQNKKAGIVCPYWGLFAQIENKLPSKYVERIRRVIYLEDSGDICKPTSVIIKLKPKDYVKVSNRWVRAIKIKGVTNRIAMIKRGKVRHIRLLGDGNIPFLIPCTNPDGTREDFRFDVGEPYRAKRFRSVINEVVLTEYALSQGLAVMVPIGMGTYEDKELLYKGEPIGFSIWGVEHPEDVRSGDELDARFFAMLNEIEEAGSREKAWRAFQKALRWVRKHNARIIEEVRRNHDAGLVHYEVHFNNTIFFDNSVTIADWEEGAHRYNMTREQFLDGVVADLVRLVEHCCSEERVYRQYYESLLKRRGGRTPAYKEVNYFMYYFWENEVNQKEREELQTLQEKLLTESKGKADLIERVVGKIILTIFGKGHFGKGIDWKDVARPFKSGFSDDKPKWQVRATTTFDPKLFVQKGERPYGRKKKQPTRAIGRAEEAIYEGRFEDAIRIYEKILRCAEGTAPKVRDTDLFGTSRLLRDRRRRRRDFDSYIHHNLASLYFALAADEEAKDILRLRIATKVLPQRARRTRRNKKS